MALAKPAYRMDPPLRRVSTGSVSKPHDTGSWRLTTLASNVAPKRVKPGGTGY